MFKLLGHWIFHVYLPHLKETCCVQWFSFISGRSWHVSPCVQVPSGPSGLVSGSSYMQVSVKWRLKLCECRQKALTVSVLGLWWTGDLSVCTGSRTLSARIDFSPLWTPNRDKRLKITDGWKSLHWFCLMSIYPQDYYLEAAIVVIYIMCHGADYFKLMSLCLSCFLVLCRDQTIMWSVIKLKICGRCFVG